ncbi:hypothetical protein J7F03_29165 [Streptomyces sp. ISL-43]|uniref:hypothetical protein n=1 Tax=Streptomyces sp. ISL-43 TaxID=2819183 RepID=UPI001BE7044F|nr:hypothetical protein [Streptomyces sp. ISL-43]MBT2451074.1 hypothetical protein [Streptomyces sp. ISL-43]
MTTPRMYFAAAALSTLALGVTMASGWGQDYPDGESTGAGTSLSAWSADWPTGSVHVEANVQHADVAPPRTDSDIVWN